MVEKSLVLKQLSGILCLLNSYSKFTLPSGQVAFFTGWCYADDSRLAEQVEEKAWSRMFRKQNR